MGVGGGRVRGVVGWDWYLVGSRGTIQPIHGTRSTTNTLVTW